jgi:hypothetical protein
MLNCTNDGFVLASDGDDVSLVVCSSCSSSSSISRLLTLFGYWLLVLVLVSSNLDLERWNWKSTIKLLIRVQVSSGIWWQLSLLIEANGFDQVLRCTSCLVLLLSYKRSFVFRWGLSLCLQRQLAPGHIVLVSCIMHWVLSCRSSLFR